MTQVTSYTIPAGNEILKARSERGKINAASFNMHQAIKYYQYWKQYPEQIEAAENAKKTLIEQCNLFAQVTYNNPFANSFGADIKLAFYYYNLLAE